MEKVNFFLSNFKAFEGVLSALFIVVCFALFAVFVRKKDFCNLKDRVQTIENTYAEKNDHTRLKEQVKGIEVKLEQIPSSETIHRLEKEVGELKGSLDGVNKLLLNINNHVNMLVENELRGK